MRSDYCFGRLANIYSHISRTAARLFPTVVCAGCYPVSSGCSTSPSLSGACLTDTCPWGDSNISGSEYAYTSSSASYLCCREGLDTLEAIYRLGSRVPISTPACRVKCGLDCFLCMESCQCWRGSQGWLLLFYVDRPVTRKHGSHTWKQELLASAVEHILARPEDYQRWGVLARWW